jgi:tetratricopeptide (TPR) repeat protein
VTLGRTIGLSALLCGLKRVGFSVAIVILGAALSADAASPTANQVAAWQTLIQRSKEAGQVEHAGDPVALAEQALAFAKAAFGLRDPRTIFSMNNLAEVLEGEGSYTKAEPLYRETLKLRRESLGQRHRETLDSMNNLAVLLDKTGNFGEAEPLFRETLKLRGETLGPRDPDTLQSINNLAFDLESQGRYSEAEALYRETLQLRRDALGARNPIR